LDLLSPTLRIAASCCVVARMRITRPG
jgi:hypothetical protein